MLKTLIIDNYDSYTYNLFQLIAKVSGEEPIVIKNDEMDYKDILKLDFDVVVISPGPGSPDKKEDFGICGEIIENLNKPIFGVCLGQQGIYYYNGGNVVLAPTPMHGRISKINHNSKGIFKGIPQGFNVTRYHSLVCKEDELENISVDARTDDGLVMAISHKYKPIYAVQFHPESICTEYGDDILRNFFELSKEFYNKNCDFTYEVMDLSADTKDIFSSLYDFDKSVMWLDSSKVVEGLSRFSIFGMSSEKRGHYLKYNVNKGKVEKIFNSGEIKIDLTQNIFQYLKDMQIKWHYNIDLPCDFQLGYIGYLGYELKRDTIVENKHVYNYPDAYFKYVDRALIVDHMENKVYILSYKDDEQWVSVIKKRLGNISSYNVELKNRGDYPKVSFVRDKNTYINDIKKSKDLIRQGETYEVFVTNRLDIEGEIDPVDYYMILRDVSPAPYSALLNFDEISVACSSMERFIKVDKNRVVETKPIKGTVRRGDNEEEDLRLIRELATDEKTMSENLMIVDLLRNDIGKVCEVGSVEVPKLMDVETYSTLHQLVSTIKGKIDKRCDGYDVLNACFPGGSMTGAPKKRTLEIIDEIENMPRGIYSGSIGYLSNNGTMDFNIVIRTALIEKNKTTVGVGGAIIDLSDTEDEFDEILLKAKGVLTAFELYCKGNTDEDIFIEGSI